MALTRTEIEILIKARDEAKGTFDNLNTVVKNVGKSSEDSGRGLDRLGQGARGAGAGAIAAGVALGNLAGVVARNLVSGFRDTIQAANRLDAGLIGLSSVATAFGQDAEKAKAAAADLAKDGLLSVGDAEFQRRCLGRMEELGSAGRTVLFVSHQLSAIAQLCDRALQINGGKIVQDGQPAEVIAHYLHQTHSAGVERVWDSEEAAPGDHLAKIMSVRVLPHEGMPPGIMDVRLPIGIEIVFRVLEWGKPVFPKIKVLDRESTIAFNAMDTDERWHEPTPPGEYAATAWIPGNLLNEGAVSGEVAICSIDFPKLEHHAAVYEAVSFEILDPGEGDSARGAFGGQWKGVVRPLLEWTCDRT